MVQKSRQIFQGIADEQLVDAAKLGDDLAFAELIERHQNSCLKLSLSILRMTPSATATSVMDTPDCRSELAMSA